MEQQHMLTSRPMGVVVLALCSSAGHPLPWLTRNHVARG
jgi:hypothetical protein